MSEPTKTTPTLEIIFLEAGITGILEKVIRENLDDEFRLSGTPHEFTWVDWIKDTRGVCYVQFPNGSVGLPAFEFAHHPVLGQDFVLALPPDTGDAKLDDRIPTRIIPVGIVPPSARRRARELILQHFGQEVEIPPLEEDIWDASALNRHDIPVDLEFREFEIRGGKRKGQKRIGSSMPSGKRVELYTGGRKQRFGSRTPPLGVLVRCIVKHERMSKVLVVWTGKTAVEAEAETERVASLLVLKTGRIDAIKRPDLKDPFAALELDPETATIGSLRRAAGALKSAQVTTDDKALADSMACAMIEAGYSLMPSDPRFAGAREDYIDDAREACFNRIQTRDQAKAREDRKPVARTEAPAAAEGGTPSNGGGKPIFDKPFGNRMGVKRLRTVAGELGVELADDADKSAILAALESKWLETHPQA